MEAGNASCDRLPSFDIFSGYSVPVGVIVSSATEGYFAHQKSKAEGNTKPEPIMSGTNSDASSVVLIAWRHDFQVKEKYKRDASPPFINWTCLKSKTFRILLVSSSVTCLGIHTPLIYMVSLLHNCCYTTLGKSNLVTFLDAIFHRVGNVRS